MITRFRARTLAAGVAVIGLAAGLLPATAGPAAQPASPSVEGAADAFPIGIFSPPNPAATTLANYQRIRDMNANFVITGNLVASFATVDAALSLAEQTGLSMFVSDRSIDFTPSQFGSAATGSSYAISTTSAPGQTFATPASEGAMILDYIELPINPATWTSGQTLTLTVYSGPDKAQQVATSSLSAPAASGGTRFDFDLFIASGTTFYFEVTSTSASPVSTAAGPGTAYPAGTAYLNGVVQSADLGFTVGAERRSWNDGGRPSDTVIQNVVQHYAGRNAVRGYHLVDEPSAQQFSQVDVATEAIRANDPAKPVYVNLNPNYANNALLGMEFAHNTGEFVRSTNRLGQVFTTGRATSHIDTIQWWIDRATWGAGEALTLTLWDSPARTTAVASATLSSQPATNWPGFALNATVTPGTSYYLELTHNGGGNDSVGWVTRSLAGKKWYGVETGAYVNGAPVGADFWFTVNQSIEPFSYDDYVYRWASTEPDVLVFDHYPFPPSGTTVNAGYFSNLEVIRDQSRAAAVDFWSYLQSVGITGMLRAPSQNDMRYQVYTNLAYRAKGLIYFTYWKPPFAEFFQSLVNTDGTPNPSYGWAQQLNAEVLALGGVLQRLDADAVYHTGTSLPAGTTALPASFDWQPTDATKPAVISHLADATGKEYVFVVNRDNTTGRTVTFDIDATIVNVEEISKSTGLPVGAGFDAVNHTLAVTLAPGEGRLFVVTK
ncbi:hypothetical protein [Jiangella muralis]|uniref:hypothetical protein n=1 Tax=Jiangella muralis TaxID=702383 RepID=UPI00069D3B4E|nr:hypothetical protein [Jiangella muralis]